MKAARLIFFIGSALIALSAAFTAGIFAAAEALEAVLEPRTVDATDD